MMGENVAWIVMFAVVVPVLFTVVKLAWSERHRHTELCVRLSRLEEQFSQLQEVMGSLGSRRQ